MAEGAKGIGVEKNKEKNKEWSTEAKKWDESAMNNQKGKKWRKKESEYTGNKKKR